MKLKIMTFNLRVDVPVDGINSFSGRRERIKETIRYEKPDVIGLQEATDGMSEWLRSALKGSYTLVGTGRMKDYSGEGARILYNHKKFELMRLETHWLSETPELPESRFAADQSICPRVYTMAEFCHKKNRRVFRMINTHLDHVGELAQLCGVTQIMQKFYEENRRLPCPNVLTGDFNATPDTPVVKTTVAYMTDLTEALPGTFHQFGQLPEAERPKIDYIFTDAKPAGSAYIVPDESVGGVYLSDHFPLCAFIEIE